MCDVIFTAHGAFSDEKYDIKWKEHLLWNIANIVAFSSRKPYTTKKIVPLKTCIVHKTFQAFILKCVNWLSKNCVVKIKINLDI